MAAITKEQIETARQEWLDMITKTSKQSLSEFEVAVMADHATLAGSPNKIQKGLDQLKGTQKGIDDTLKEAPGLADAFKTGQGSNDFTFKWKIIIQDAMEETAEKFDGLAGQLQGLLIGRKTCFDEDGAVAAEGTTEQKENEGSEEDVAFFVKWP